MHMMPLWCSSPLKHTMLVESYRPLLTGPFGCTQRWRCEPPSPQLGCYCSSVPLLHFLSGEKIVFIIFLKLVSSWISTFRQQRRSPQDKSHVQNDFTPVQNTKSQVSLLCYRITHSKWFYTSSKHKNHKSDCNVTESRIQNDFTPVQNTKITSLTVMLQNHAFKMILHQFKTQKSQVWL